MFALASAAGSVHLRNEKVEAMVKDLEKGHDARADAKAEKAGGVGDEKNGRHLFIGHDQGVVGILDEDV